MNTHSDHTDLETRLRREGSSLLAQLAAVDLVPSVLARIETHATSPRVPRRARTRRPLALALAIGAIAIAAAWALSTLVFDGGAVTVRREPAPARPTTVTLALGHPVSARVAHGLPNSVRLDQPGLGHSATAWVDPAVPGQFSLTFPPSRTRPELGASGVGLLIQSFDGDGREVIRKYLTNGSRAEPVEIAGTDAVFLSGADHSLFYLQRDGSYAEAPGRVVGHALIFRLGRLTVRIEANLPRRTMVQLARSIRAST